MSTLRTAALLTCLSTAAGAQTLVRDINSGAVAPRGSDPATQLETSTGTYFSSEVPGYGRELWFTDGTAAGTRLVADIRAGFQSSNPTELVELPGGTVLFRAGSLAHGEELWRTDGTAAGTALVLDVKPGSVSSQLSSMTVLGSEAFFIADDGTNGLAVWRTDGTAAGTSLFLDFGPSSSGVTNGEELTTSGGSLFISALVSGAGELWVSDGTVAGTSNVLSAGSSISAPRALTPFQSGVLFNLYPGNPFATPWFSDGTLAGTVQLSAALTTPGDFHVNGSSAYFAANGPQQRELYTTDGTPAGTQIVADLSTHWLFGSADPRGIGFIGSDFLFFAKTGLSTPATLHITDGTAAGTVEISQTATAPTNSLGTNRQGILYFPASSADGEELWRSDGTQGGTYAVRDINPGSASSAPTGLAQAGGWLVFAADDELQGVELWRSDGTNGGTSLLANLAPEPLSAPSNPAVLGAFRDQLIFGADNGLSGFEPWVSDGTSAGTIPLADTVNGPIGSNPSQFAATERFAFFFSNTSGVGQEPWVSDGTPSGTHLLLNIRPGLDHSRVSGVDPIVYRERIYFVADDGTHGPELWSTDGTAGGTQMVIDLAVGAFGSNPRGLLVWNDRLYFGASTAATGTELFVTEGTAASTSLVADIVPGSGSALLPSSFELVATRDALFFPAFEPASGVEPWTSDGTAAGTRLLVDTYPLGAGRPYSFVAQDDQVFFFADSGMGYQPWRSDGTNVGTFVLGDTNPARVSSLLVACSDFAAFAVDYAGTRTIWSTDGTVPGTGPIHTIQGTGLAQTSRLWALGETRVLFRANDDVTGDELWITDGSSAGTQLLADIAPEHAGTFQIKRVGSRLFFDADDGLHGRELHMLPFAQTQDWAKDQFGAGCPGTGGVVPRIDVAGAPIATGAQPFDVILREGFPNSVAVLAWGGDRFPIGVAGCTLYLGPFFGMTVTGTDSAGRAAIPFVVSPSLVGQTFRFQYGVLDPAGAWNGLVALSGGLELVAGP